MKIGASKVDIAIVAPCPIGLDIDNGWLDRISVVDRVFFDKSRIYLNYASHHHSKAPCIAERAERVFEVYLNPISAAHKAFVTTIVENVQAVYVHTVHHAKHVLDWLPSGKVLVDIHGTVPEEERMLGRFQEAAEYEPIEAAVLKGAKGCVMVSNAMRQHFLNKYPNACTKLILLPIVQKTDQRPRGNIAPASEIPVRVVYSGGVQVWQNVDAMLRLSAATRSFAQFTFLSKEWHAIQAAARQHEAPEHTTFAVADKARLQAEYESADFGLVLRDENTVNRVSCPTKLFDYLSHGIIPVARFPSLGDFNEYGYSYVTEEEFGLGFFPDIATRRWMIDNNREVLSTCVAAFKLGLVEVRALAT